MHTYANKAERRLVSQLEQGDFSLLKHWLNKNIHAKASLLNHQQLLESATNESLNPHYFLNRIKKRYLNPRDTSCSVLED